MNFLKKLGQIVSTGLSLFLGFAPIFARAVPSAGATISEITDDLTKVASVIQSVEVFGAVLTDKSITGADKLRAATPMVAQVILQSELLVDAATGKRRDIADETLFKQGCSKIGDGMADILNSLKG